MDTQVIVVGAGPVGLTLAIDLGRRGIRCMLIERKDAPEFLPKMERCNARTMEMFRRLGLGDKIRAAGLRGDVPMDVYVVLSMTEKPLLHLEYPSVDAARKEIAACNDGTTALEPYQLISQYTLEPLLKSIAESLPSVTVRYGCEFVSLEQDAQGVTVTARTSAGATETMRAAYAVGCDGGASPVRKQLGISLRGEGNHYHVADDRASFLIMQDSTKHFTLHARVGSDEEMKSQFEKVVGVPVKYEMLSCNPWRQNLLLADRYRDRRVFLA